ncbi:MAG: polymerase, sigma-24 subunit, subfamily [Actinomycetia bacterium]|nr:polymerase, sigma-24 subunit, subfamily [Actinomycetes bacterium]
METPPASATPISGTPVPKEDDDWITEMFVGQYWSLVRLSVLLLDDHTEAEDIVQEAYIRLSAAQHRIRDPEKALAYLRTTVVNLSRSLLRRRRIAFRHRTEQQHTDVGEDTGLAVLDRTAIIAALRVLPRRSREVVVLRYYLDLTEAQTADALGLSVGSVKAYSSRGREQLAKLLREELV